MATLEISSSEQLYSIPQAAKKLGIPVSSLRRAVNAGFIPSHTIFNSRKRVRLSEIIAVIENQNDGGQGDE